MEANCHKVSAFRPAEVVVPIVFLIVIGLLVYGYCYWKRRGLRERSQSAAGNNGSQYGSTSNASLLTNELLRQNLGDSFIHLEKLNKTTPLQTFSVSHYSGIILETK